MDTDPVAEMSAGFYAGRWAVPTDGFSWERDLRQVHEARFAPRPLNDPPRPAAGPWLVLQGERMREYAPLRRRSLLDDFVAVGRQPTLAKIKGFADRYGPLYEPRPRPNERALAPFYVDSYQVWHHATTQAATLRWLWERAMLDDADGLLPFVAWERNPRMVSVRFVAHDGQPDVELTRRKFRDGAEFEQVLAGLNSPWIRDLPLARQGDDSGHRLRRLRYDDVLEPIREFVRMEVNARLVGHVHLQLMHERAGAIRSVPDSLLSAVYVQFALEIAGGRTVGRACGNPQCTELVTGRLNKMFCSPACKARYHDARRPAEYREKRRAKYQPRPAGE